MVVILPDKTYGAPAVATSLSAQQLTQFRDLVLTQELVELWLPRFEADPPGVNLVEALETLGVRTPFSRQADFGGIAAPRERHPLFLGQVVQKVYVSTDEEGTEAAAGNTIELSPLGVVSDLSKPILVHVDHPFLYAIQDVNSGACLFLGSVADPGTSP